MPVLAPSNSDVTVADLVCSLKEQLKKKEILCIGIVGWCNKAKRFARSLGHTNRSKNLVFVFASYTEPINHHDDLRKGLGTLDLTDPGGRYMYRQMKYDIVFFPAERESELELLRQCRDRIKIVIIAAEGPLYERLTELSVQIQNRTYLCFSDYSVQEV